MARPDGGNPLRTGIFGIALVACLVLVSFGYTQLPFWPQGKPYEAYFTDAGGISPGNDVNQVIEPLAENYLRLNALGAYGSFFNIYYCSIRMKINGPAGSDILIPFGGPPDPSKGRCSENG